LNYELRKVPSDSDSPDNTTKPSGKCNGFTDPKHTATAVKANLDMKTHDGPQSPDLNIIEAVWDHVDRERNKRQPTSKEELWNVLQGAWRTIPEDYLKT